MPLCPAVHIAYFGVFPDRMITDDFAESLNARKAGQHALALAMEATDTTPFDRADATGLHARDSLVKNYDDADVAAIRTTAQLRMRCAYEQAAKNDWLKPMASRIFMPGSILPESTADIREEMEHVVFESFYRHASQSTPHTITFAPIALDRHPVAMMAHIRCLIEGEAQPFLSTSNQAHMFKSATEPFIELDVNPAWFQLDAIDSVAHCRENPLFKRSFAMGYAPA